MKIPEYVTVAEVKRVCRELKLRDWTAMKGTKVLPKEAKIILPVVNTQKMKVPLEEFRRGLEVELEHGTMYKDVNVTNNHPLLTGMIVLAHLKETIDYYQRLEVAELEGDLLKAVVAKNPEKVKNYIKRLFDAKGILSKTESGQL